GEVIVHARAKRWQWTTRKEEGNRQGLAFKIAPINPAARLISENEFRNQGPYLELTLRFGQRLGDSFLGNTSFDFFNIIDPIVVLSNGKPKNDGISRLKAGKLVRIFHREGHGHGIHVTGHRLVSDDGDSSGGARFQEGAFD